MKLNCIKTINERIFYTIFFLLITAISSTAQYIYDSNGSIIPFSLSNKYSHLIDTSNIVTCMLPSYNNDSLYWEKNFENHINSTGNGISCGFSKDTSIQLKTVAKKYRLIGGYLYLYKIESKTADRLGVTFSKTDIPDGSLISFYSSKNNIIKQYDYPGVYTGTSWRKTNDGITFDCIQLGPELFIEYFEPDTVKKLPELTINRIHYFFPPRMPKSFKEVPVSLKKKYPNFDFERGILLPFSVSKKYKSLIDKSKIKTLTLPAYNNDLLFWEQNFEKFFINDDKKNCKGDQMDTLAVFKEVANKYQLDEGTLWILKIESKGVLGHDVICEQFTVPNGALWVVYSPNDFIDKRGPLIYNKFYIDRLSPYNYSLFGWRKGRELFIEYFEPNDAEFSAEIILNKVTYPVTVERLKQKTGAPKWMRIRYPDYSFDEGFWGNTRRILF